MTTADEYRAEIVRITAAVFTEGQAAVRNGEISQANFEAFVAAAGVEAPEDEETRQAREALEDLKARLRLASRAALPYGTRDAALRRIGSIA